MPVHKTTRADLRLLSQMGDVEAAAELIQRSRVKTVKAALALVVCFDVPLTPALFDVVADAWNTIHPQPQENP